MKKTTNILILVMLLLNIAVSINPLPQCKEIKPVILNDFNTACYDEKAGLNTKNIGNPAIQIIDTEGKSKTITSMIIQINTDPYETMILFTDTNNLYSKSNSGYLLINKSLFHTVFHISEKNMITYDTPFTTIKINGYEWIEFTIPCFSREYLWNEPGEDISDKKTYSWGKTDTIQFKENPMYMNLVSEEDGSLVYEFKQKTGKQGQPISFNKQYLQSKGITDPVFEYHGRVIDGMIKTSENKTHITIYPPHFSYIGVHNAQTGTVPSIVEEYSSTSYSDYYICEQNTVGASYQTVGTNDYETQSFTTGENDSFITGLQVYRTYSGDAAFDRVHFALLDSGNTVLAHTYPNGIGSGPGWLSKGWDITEVSPNTKYTLKIYDTSTGSFRWYYTGDVYSDGEAGFGSAYDFAFRITGCRHFNVTRVSGAVSETNNISTYTFTDTFTGSGGYIILAIPISDDVTAITRVYNTTSNSNYSEQASYADINTTDEYFYDAAAGYVYASVDGINLNEKVALQVNCSYSSDINITYPQYLEVGDYFIASGIITNSTGEPVDGVLTNTILYYSNGSQALTVPSYVNNGNYQVFIPTNSLTPGTYTVIVKLTDIETGFVFQDGSILYLSTYTGSGIYTDAIVYFNFYNTNQGLGLPRETLKLYVNGTRLYDTKYHTYTGKTLNITVKDYYDTLLFWENYTINESRTFLDLGLTFHSWLFGNKNDDYYMISLRKDGATRWWERGLVPYSEREFLIPSGTYRMRIYDRDYNELHNMTYSIVNSKVYVIHGTNLSLIINGLSVVTGQLLEFRDEFQQAIQPDFVRIITNPPTIYSIFEMRGMLMDTCQQICPALIVQGETRNTTYDHDILSYPLIPVNDTLENGTISIVEDTLFLSGNASYVNITYHNGTLLQNTSYVPSVVDLFGETIWINCSRDIFIRRETIYQQNKQFYWTYWSASGHGPIPQRKGYHTATVNVSNTLNTTLYNVYVIVELSNETSCDSTTLRLQDVANSGAILTPGEHYDVTDKAVQFRLSGSMPSSTYRPFTIDYYEDTSDSYQYTSMETSVDGYGDTNYDGKEYHYCNLDWTNNEDKTHRGELYIKYDFDTPTPIKTTSVIVKNMDTNTELNSSTYISTDSYLRISHNGLGDVAPGNGRQYRIFFQLEQYAGADTIDFTMTTPFFYGITLQIILTIIALIPIGYGVYKLTIGKKSRVYERKYVLIAGLGFFFLFFVFFFSNIGM